MLNGLDLFSGYGGGSTTLRGIVRTVAYCEVEPKARDILLSRMWRGEIDRAPIWDDVRTLRKELIKEPIDLISGGWPCQDISVAGTRVGLDGSRSSLFFEVVRIIRSFRPSFVFLENVPNVLRLGFGRVAGDLAKLRYDLRWGVLSAHDMGAPHLRERLWILAANSDSLRQWGLQSKQLIRRDKALWNHRTNPKQIIANYLEFGRREGISEQASWKWGKDSICNASQWLTRDIPEPSLPRSDDGLHRWRDRYRALGNGWVPQTAREAFTRLSGLKT